jgi:hypothetical protein
MSAASRTEGAPTAFMWGINGAMSVVASVFAVLIAMFLGINAAFGAGFLAYGIAAVSLVLIVRKLATGTAPVEPAGDGDDDASADGAETVTAGASAAPAATPATAEGNGNGNGAGDPDGDGDTAEPAEEPEPASASSASAGEASKD